MPICPQCYKKMDRRASLCRGCSNQLLPHRYGTGKNGPGKTINAGGYVQDTITKGYEHRAVLERKIGRPLRPEEVCHHVNGDRKDNRQENLDLHPSQSDHMIAHGPGLVKNLGAYAQKGGGR